MGSATRCQTRCVGWASMSRYRPRDARHGRPRAIRDTMWWACAPRKPDRTSWPTRVACAPTWSAVGPSTCRYQRTDYVERKLPPFPVHSPSNSRVTDETAAVHILLPVHPVSRFPTTSRPLTSTAGCRNATSTRSSPSMSAIGAARSANPGKLAQLGGQVIADVGKGRSPLHVLRVVQTAARRDSGCVSTVCESDQPAQSAALIAHSANSSAERAADSKICAPASVEAPRAGHDNRADDGVHHKADTAVRSHAGLRPVVEGIPVLEPSSCEYRTADEVGKPTHSPQISSRSRRSSERP